jgi:hypothetical protein
MSHATFGFEIANCKVVLLIAPIDSFALIDSPAMFEVASLKILVIVRFDYRL